MAEPRQVVAAGAVVLRRGASGEREVLLVHRPRYDDWSMPKGKLDRRESLPEAAVREVEEETGLLVHLGVPLSRQTYRVNGGAKVAHYWVARVVGDDDVSAYEPNREIDRVAWVPLRKADRRLSYPRDRSTLAEAVELRRRTRTIVVLRHARAASRKRWRHDDRLRPLLAEGIVQAERLPRLLSAYRPQRVVTSSSTRCVQTLTPYATRNALPLELDHALSEEDASPDRLAALVGDVVSGDEDVVLCTHRPVLPGLLEPLGVPERKLEPSGMLVVHHRRGQVVAVEEHPGP
jgi:8-oxo-dGTP pyrophosphatase MutT (NUDIX family)/phosphohistidine phosphatase SixA